MDPIVKFVEKLLPLTPQFPVSAAAYDVRVHRELCHFSRPGPASDATVSTALGRIVVKMAELLMNSAIPSEGSMRASWPRLRNSYYANRMG